MAKRKGLGRGLDALLGGTGSQTPAEAIRAASEVVAAPEKLDGTLRELPVEFLQRGKYQPRRDMHQEALEELAVNQLGEPVDASPIATRIPRLRGPPDR